MPCTLVLAVDPIIHFEEEVKKMLVHFSELIRAQVKQIFAKAEEVRASKAEPGSDFSADVKAIYETWNAPSDMNDPDGANFATDAKTMRAYLSLGGGTETQLNGLKETVNSALESLSLCTTSELYALPAFAGLKPWERKKLATLFTGGRLSPLRFQRRHIVLEDVLWDIAGGGVKAKKEGDVEMSSDEPRSAREETALNTTRYTLRIPNYSATIHEFQMTRFEYLLTIDVSRKSSSVTSDSRTTPHMMTVTTDFGNDEESYQMA